MCIRLCLCWQHIAYGRIHLMSCEWLTLDEIASYFDAFSVLTTKRSWTTFWSVQEYWARVFCTANDSHVNRTVLCYPRNRLSEFDVCYLCRVKRSETKCKKEKQIEIRIRNEFEPHNQRNNAFCGWFYHRKKSYICAGRSRGICIHRCNFIDTLEL